MILYTGGKAPNPRRVAIFLAEKGVEIETVQFDIAKLEHKGEVLTKLNARQRLPVLELDGGVILTETVAICRYIEELYPDPPLLGVDSLDQAQVEMWQRRIELELFMSVANSFRHLHPIAKALEPVQIPDWGKLNQSRAIATMKSLNDDLSSREFIAGERFSIADITAITAFQFLKPARIEMPEDLDHLRRWFSAMMERPSTKW